MKKLVLSAILTFYANADNLKSILDYTLTHNDLSVAKDINIKKPLLESESIKKDNFPKIYIGGAYQRYNPRPLGRPGDIYNGYAKISFNIYDGGSKKNKIEAKNFEFKSLSFESKSYKKQLQFNVVNLYFNIKSLKASLFALKKAKEYLTAELKRVENLFEVGAVTEDDVKKIEASLFNTIYQIDNIKYQISNLKKNLNLTVGKKVENLGDSTILPPVNITSDTLDTIKSLQAKSKAIEYSAKALNSVYLPQIDISDTYSLSGYDRYDRTHPKGDDDENQLSLSINMLLFDGDSVKKQKEAILIQKLSLQKQINYYKKEQNKNIKLAFLNIETIKTQITSAKKSLEAANKAFEIISNRYHSGEVTVVDYLDALSVKTNTLAQYKMALYNLQVAYATYYLYTNHEIKEYVK